MDTTGIYDDGATYGPPAPSSDRQSAHAAATERLRALHGDAVPADTARQIADAVLNAIGDADPGRQRLLALAGRIIALDDPEGPGAKERRTVTLNKIITWAKDAVGAQE